MATVLYLIRHGETEGATAEPRYKGTIDVPLSKAGEAQLEETARRLQKIPFSAVYASTLRRAVRSAELIAKPHGLVTVSRPVLRERHFGKWEGLRFDECRQQFPEAFEAWVRDPEAFAPVDGESTLEVHQRLVPEIKRLLHRHREETFAIVAHGGVNRVLLCDVLGMPLSQLFRLEQDFGAVNIVEFRDETPVVKLLNGVLWR